MPGLVGHIAIPPMPASIDRALQKLAHFAHYAISDFRYAPTVHLGRIARRQSDAVFDSAVTPHGRVAVHLTGHVRRRTRPYGDISAADFLRDYLQGTLDPDNADGGFIGCIVDLGRNRLQLFNDRLGTLPLMYAMNDHGFAFGPEAKAIFPTLGMQPRYADPGLVSFLSAGYCLGDQTLFEGVHFLEPGTILTVDLGTLALSSERYWKMAYAEDQSLVNRKAASAILFDAIKESHESLLGARDSVFDILLSGGLDSRCMLACAARAGRIPNRTFGWGMRADIPYSDSDIASKIARRFGVRYDFFGYDTAAFLDNAKSWSYISELANDNIGWYAEGASVLAHSYDPSADYTLVGDEAWGWGGVPANTEQAISSVIPHTVAPLFARSVKPEMRDSCNVMYRASIERGLRESDNNGLAEQKDYLYLHGRVARFIFSLGYYKELATEVRRPFLTRAILDVVRGLPRELRYHKNLYRSVLHTYFPELRRFPQNMCSSLPDWRYDVTYHPPLRDFFTGLLSRKSLEASAISGLLDPCAIERAWTDYLQVPVRPIDRNVRRMRLIKHWLVPEHARIWRARRGDALGGIGPRTDLDFFRALALLILLERQFPELER
jgi:hypothetical protein